MIINHKIFKSPVIRKKFAKRSTSMLVCKLCNFFALNNYILTKHIKTAHIQSTDTEETAFVCPFCDEQFKYKSELKSHISIIHLEKKLYECDTTMLRKIRHENNKTAGEKPYKCTKCPYACTDRLRLAKHLAQHEGNFRYTCEYCTYATNERYLLGRHLVRHAKAKKPFKCTICQEKFTNSNSLKQHQLTHRVQKPIFPCNLCPTTCTRSYDLRKHVINMHEPQSILVCKICLKVFRDRYGFKLHKRFHKGEKCYECPECAFVALYEHQINLHMQTHSDFKPLVCDVCGRSFKYKKALEDHLNECLGIKSDDILGQNENIISLNNSLNEQKDDIFSTDWEGMNALNKYFDSENDLDMEEFIMFEVIERDGENGKEHLAVIGPNLFVKE